MLNFFNKLLFIHICEIPHPILSFGCGSKFDSDNFSYIRVSLVEFFTKDFLESVSLRSKDDYITTILCFNGCN